MRSVSENIRIRNVYYMLAYAYHALNEAGCRSIETEDFKNVHDLLAAILINGVAQQIKRGLNRDYLSNKEVISSLKGKLIVSESVKRHTLLKKRMICQFDVFSEDTPMNRILKTAMTLLMRHGDVKKENSGLLRKLLLYFSDVSPLSPYGIDWNALTYHRHNATYKMLLNICRLVFDGLLLSSKDGGCTLAEFIDDQQMHRLFEKFVLEYYRKEYPQFKASASHIDWNIDGADSALFLPLMKSDITLTHAGRSMIIDTKYYSRSMQSNPQFQSTSLISGNLYQIFTYVKNKDREVMGNVSGVLLYAKTDETVTPDCDYRICGNRIAVKTLNLGAEWLEIKRQLDDLTLYITE